LSAGVAGPRQGHAAQEHVVLLALTGRFDEAARDAERLWSDWIDVESLIAATATAENRSAAACVDRALGRLSGERALLKRAASGFEPHDVCLKAFARPRTE
jgi:hypothetical protein